MMNKAFFLTMVVLACAGINAEETTQDPPRDPDAAEAAEEDARESKLSETEQIAALKSIKGKVMIGNEGTDNPEIVGQIFADGGQSYFIKLAKKDLLKKLQTFNNKTATLSGKLRNKEKYLIVQSISDGGGSTGERTKRGGI